MNHLEDWNDLRIKKAHLYKKLLADTPLIFTEVLPEAKHVYHVLAVRTEYRDELKNYLYQNGIETGIHYPVPVHKQLVFNGICKHDEDMLNAENICNELLSLPIYPELDDEKIIFVSNTIKAFFTERNK